MTTIQQRVVAAVIRDGDQFLICQRPAHRRHGCLWEFPGGKCEAGETDAQAITRELAEELGVEVSAAGDALFAALDPDSSFVIAFLPVDIRGEPVCIEHAALAWASRHEMTAYELAPSDARFLNSLGLDE